MLRQDVLLALPDRRAEYVIVGVPVPLDLSHLRRQRALILHVLVEARLGVFHRLVQVLKSRIEFWAVGSSLQQPAQLWLARVDQVVQDFVFGLCLALYVSV